MLSVLPFAYSSAHKKGGKPGEEVLANEKLNGEELVVDVTEHSIERPKKQQRDWYSGKKTAFG